MSCRLYIDENVQGSVIRRLRARGVDLVTAQEDGMSGRLDPDLLDRAFALGRILFTQDDDFLREAHQRQSSGRSFRGIIYVHPLLLSIGQRIDELELIARLVEPEELDDRIVFLPLA